MDFLSGKIKEVASNCIQIEANIRSVRDKSVIFDNELKQIKDKIAQTEYKLENKDQDGAKEVKKMIKDKESEVKKLAESMEDVKKKVQQSMQELKNFKEHNRTKEGEDEERQVSLEQNLLDVRTYVEQMLQETNKQLTGIAGEVEVADRKIARCAADIGDVLERQETSSSGSGQAVTGLEKQVRDLQEQQVMAKVEWSGELLELKGTVADSRTEVLGKVEAVDESVSRLRRDTTTSLEQLERTATKVSETGAERERKATAGLAGLRDSLESQVAGLTSKVAGFDKKVAGASQETPAIKEIKQEVKDCLANLGKVHMKVDHLMTAEESRAAQFRSVKEALAKVEREGTGKRDNEEKGLVLLKEELAGVVRTGEAARKEVDHRVENMRKNMIEMIGTNEIKTSELDDKLRLNCDAVKEIKEVQSNNAIIATNKVMAAKVEFENLLNDKFKAKNPLTLDLEKVSAELRKELDKVKTDMRNNDMESFKNIVNSTNDTHNKLISSIQSNVDQILREKNQQEGQAASLEERITRVSNLREAGEFELKKMLQKQQELGQQADEKILSLQMSLREVQGGVEGLSQVQTGLATMRTNVAEVKQGLEDSLTQQKQRMTELQQMVDTELKNMKGKADGKCCVYGMP